MQGSRRNRFDCLLRAVDRLASGTERCGIELDAALGSSRGRFGGHEYFKCDANSGILVTPKKVKALSPMSPDHIGQKVRAVATNNPVFWQPIALYQPPMRC